MMSVHREIKITFCFISFCTLLMYGNLHAQTREDVLYLANGCILKGKVIENISGDKTTIKIVGNNIIVVPDSLIKMLLLNQAIPVKEHANIASPVEMTSNVNFYGGSQNSGGFTFITSYRFPFRLSAGAGMGIEWFDHQQIPFIADIKYCFLKGWWSPYIYTQCGYAVPLSQEGEDEWTENHGGALAGTGVGMRFNFSRRNAVVFSFGYRYQKTETLLNQFPWSSTYPQYETTRYDEYKRITFSFGFLFN
jgi:hypothetical protein